MEKYVDLLYDLAFKSYECEDVPVGAIILKNDKILSTGYNTRKSCNKVIGHAEVNAICMAEQEIGDFRLNGCILLTTLKPCKMCYEIIEAARIDKVYYLLDQNTDYSYDNQKYVKIKIDKKYIERYEKLFLDFFKKIR